MSGPYRIILDKEACSHCLEGATWTIAWDEGGKEVALGESWEGEVGQEIAEERAQQLNDTFAFGQGEMIASCTMFLKKAGRADLALAIEEALG